MLISAVEVVYCCDITGPTRKFVWALLSLCCVGGLTYNMYTQSKFCVLLKQQQLLLLLLLLATVIIITTINNNNNVLGGQFLPRCMKCRRGIAMRILSVCLSVCPSIRLSVRHTRDPWQNGRKIGPDFYTIRKNVYPSFLRRRMVGGGRPLLREIWGQPTPVGSKSPIFNQ